MALAFVVLARCAAGQETIQERIRRCRPPPQPAVFGPISRLDPLMINNCGNITITELIKVNAEVTDISLYSLSATADILFFCQKRGPVHLLNVLSDGDRARWDVLRPPMRAFRAQTCLNYEGFCDVASVTPLAEGFLVVDRHRLMEFNYTWQPTDVESLIASVGNMNTIQQVSTSENSIKFLYPTMASVYKPHSRTHIGPNFAMTPHMPDANNRFIFVTDTGHHRVVMLNATSPGQMDFTMQFGGPQPRDGTDGFHWPWGLAVMQPAYESQYKPVFLNVYVADRVNDRVVKLNVGYSLQVNELDYFVEPDWQMVEFDDRLRMTWGGAYGPHNARPNETISQPVGVTLYRHYILVAEALGNVISVLTPHHEDFDRLIFVTHLAPALGVQLTGYVTASAQGYVWYTYLQLPAEYNIGSIYLTEALRESVRLSPLETFLGTCVNDTWYHQVLVPNKTMFIPYVGAILTGAGVNWMHPDSPAYVDIMSYNISARGTGPLFDLDAFNQTVFKGQIQICLPPPPSTTPAMASGNQAGWDGARTAGATRSASGGWRAGLWLLALSAAGRGRRAMAG